MNKNRGFLKKEGIINKKIEDFSMAEKKSALLDISAEIIDFSVAVCNNV